MTMFAFGIGCLMMRLGHGQVTPEDHAKHHPSQGSTSSPATGQPLEPAKPQTPAPGMGGMGDMGEMMKGMGAPKPKELYPSLMEFPELSSERREGLRLQAEARMQEGLQIWKEGLESLGRAVEKDDYAAMQVAVEKSREGVSRFESGVAARRALAEGKPPRQVALQWFKGEMNLQPPQGIETRGGLFGVTLLHFFTMGLLIAFAVAMLAMYFFKMRRTAALFGRIEMDSGRPAPGSAPLLTGAPGPSKPVAPPAGGAPPPPAPKPAPDDATASTPLTAPAGGGQRAKTAPNAAPSAPAATAPKPPQGAPLATPRAAQTPPNGNGSAQERPATTHFSCRAPTARAVCLAGTFNGWDPNATPMIKDAEGNWDVAVKLPPGRYEFRFVVDGVLCCEPGCEGPHRGCSQCVPNSSGTMNRLIEVT